MNLEENAVYIVFWILMIISSILCGFYMYFRFALRRVISVSQQQTYAIAPGEALSKASHYKLMHFIYF